MFVREPKLLAMNLILSVKLRDGPLFFIGGGGGEGLPFLGLVDNFFLKNNAFQTISISSWFLT